VDGILDDIHDLICSTAWLMSSFSFLIPNMIQSSNLEYRLIYTDVIFLIVLINIEYRVCILLIEIYDYLLMIDYNMGVW